MTWQLIDNTPNKHSHSRSVYGIEGCDWPRLSIALYIYTDKPMLVFSEPAISIESAIKYGEGAIWERCGIPIELLGDLQEMIRKVADEYSN